MFDGEDKQRKAVLRIIRATNRGDVIWRKSGPLFEGDYYAEWRGITLTARWLRDETALILQSQQDPKRAVSVSYRVMDGLKEAIFTQLDPHYDKQRESWLEKARRKSDLEKSDQEKLLDDILDD